MANSNESVIKLFLRQRLGGEPNLRYLSIRDGLIDELDNVPELYIARDVEGEQVIVGIDGNALGITRLNERVEAETADFLESTWFAGLEGATLLRRRRITDDYTPVSAITLADDRIPGRELHFDVRESREKETAALVDRLEQLVGLPRRGAGEPLVAFG